MQIFYFFGGREGVKYMVNIFLSNSNHIRNVIATRALASIDPQICMRGRVADVISCDILLKIGLRASDYYRTPENGVSH